MALQKLLVMSKFLGAAIAPNHSIAQALRCGNLVQALILYSVLPRPHPGRGHTKCLKPSMPKTWRFFDGGNLQAIDRTLRLQPGSLFSTLCLRKLSSSVGTCPLRLRDQQLPALR